jgi:hypothetical protein
VKFRTILAAALFAGAPLLAHAQSASAPLAVTATVVSTCRVDVPRAAEPSVLPALPVEVVCARRGAAARVQRPALPRRRDVRHALLVIDF